LVVTIFDAPLPENGTPLLKARELIKIKNIPYSDPGFKKAIARQDRQSII